ncbi:hypothetical protein Asi02nite_64980 [Asanoa siamensis]|uniref:Uncharacterized protein n=1 Tax=Asanoa siamensis TaxID=926357 RepID=A0ABQ4D0C2_9ACTN|nr:hypothetical protein Asi02nite_64980 [Asanoa siamensis]
MSPLSDTSPGQSADDDVGVARAALVEHKGEIPAALGALTTAAAWPYSQPSEALLEATVSGLLPQGIPDDRGRCRPE